MDKKFVFLLVVLVLFLFGCTNNNPAPAVICVQDAKICPNGLSVGRVPPDCNFAPCPSAPVGQITSPSSEAVTACNNKVENDSCNFTLSGQNYSGTCYSAPGVLTCIPR